MLTQSKVVPTISAFAFLRGQHNYNVQPFAPMGCNVEMYEMTFSDAIASEKLGHPALSQDII